MKKISIYYVIDEKLRNKNLPEYWISNVYLPIECLLRRDLSTQLGGTSIWEVILI